MATAKATTSRRASKKEAPGTGLALPGDPLVLASGEIVEPVKDPEPDPAPINKMINPKDFRPSRRRSVKELPASVGVVNACSAVFMYTFLGLTDREIADCLRITSIEVNEVRQMPAYTELFETVLRELINSSSELLEARIAAYSHHAVGTVAALSRNAKHEMVKLKASQDLLDRGGVRIKGAEERKNLNVSELRIVMIDDEKKVEVNIGGV